MFLLAWLALSSPWLFGTITIPYDAKAHFQAQIQFLANALHSGQSPFWAPHVFVGSPQIADPQSLIFSPAFLLAYFEAIPTFRMLDAYVLGLLALAGLAMIKLFEDRGWHPAGALLTAIAVAFGSSAAWRIQHIGQIQSYALFCIALWLLDRALRRRSIGWGIAAGLVTGTMLAEPDQVCLLGSYILAALAIGHVLEAGDLRSGLRQSLAPLTAAGLATVAVAAIPLLFTILFLAESNRPVVPLAEAARGSLHPASLLTAIVGDLFGALDPKVDYWGPYSESWNPRELTLSQNMSQLYLGALPALLLLTLGLVSRILWAREIRVFTISAGIMVIYGLGTYTPLFEPMYRFVPGVSLFRRPADATFMIGAMLAILGGYVLHRWLNGDLRTKASGLSLAAGLIIGATGAVALAIALSEQKLALAWKPMLHALGWMSAALALLLLARAGGLRRPALAMIAAGGFMTADLAVNNGPNESTALAAADYEVLDPRCRNETIRFLKERMRRTPGSAWRDRVEMVGLGFEWPNSALVHGLDHTLGYNPIRVDVVSTALGAGDHVAGPDQRQFSPLFPSYRSTLANLLGLRFVASSVPIEQVDTRLPTGSLRFVARTRHAYIYENPNALPRVMLVGGAMPVNFKTLLAHGTWPAFDPRETVLLDRADQTLWTLPDDPNSRDKGEGSAWIVRYENTIVEVEVDTPAPRYLLLNDLYHPWWVAEIGGSKVPLLKANVMFRAVPVPAGRHIVRFEFRPFSGALSDLKGIAGQGR